MVAATVLTAGADPTNVAFRRALAFIADSILAWVIATGIVALFGFDLYVEGDRINGVATTNINPAAAPIYFAASFFYGVITSVFLVASRGWTPGKLFLGIRVVAWDGRAPGLGRAAARAVTRGLLDLFGCIYWITGYAIINISKGHKAPHDMVAGTYVIDASYYGRVIVEVGGKIGAGHHSASPDLVAKLNAEQAALTGVSVPSGKRATEPFYDKARDTYVVYSQKQQSWLQLSKSSGQWEKI